MGDDAKVFANLVYLDLFPGTTRELREWERLYGLTPSATAGEVARRLMLAAEWRSTGGQSVSYIQGVLHTAGFTNVFVHEWWESVGPYVARDPRDHTVQPLIGSLQCSDEGICGEFDAQCSSFLINDPRYFANLNLGPLAPPPVSSNEDSWPYFLYFSGPVFPDPAVVFSDVQQDLRRLIQKLKPAQQWAVLLLSGGEFLVTENNDFLVTEDNDFLMV